MDNKAISQMESMPTSDLLPPSCPKPNISSARSPAINLNNTIFDEVCRLVEPKSVLEIGSWMGSSALAWKRASLPFSSKTIVYCIDTWLGSVEHYLSLCGEGWDLSQLAFGEAGPSFYDDFCFNVHAAGYQNSIIPFRSESSSALAYLKSIDVAFDVVYVDAAHDALSVCRDVIGSLEVVSSRGLVCGDDFDWPSVRDGLFLASITRSYARAQISILSKERNFVLVSCKSTMLYFQSLGYRSWNPAVRIARLPGRLGRILRGLP